MERQQIEERVIGLVSEQVGLNPHEVKPESNLVDDLGCDSLDLVEIVMATEEDFEIEISDADAENLRTVRDIADHLEREFAARAARSDVAARQAAG